MKFNCRECWVWDKFQMSRSGSHSAWFLCWFCLEKDGEILGVIRSKTCHAFYEKVHQLIPRKHLWKAHWFPGHCLPPQNVHSIVSPIKTFLLRNTQSDKMTNHSRCVSDMLEVTQDFHWQAHSFMNSAPFGTQFWWLEHYSVEFAPADDFYPASHHFLISFQLK